MKPKINLFCKRIFFLPVWLTALIAVPSFAVLILLFLYGGCAEWLTILEIPIYCLSAYALMITCTGIGRMIRRITEHLQSHALWGRLRNDVRLRTMVTMIPGLLLNALYVLTNVGMAVLNHTSWFIYLGGYDLVLTVMKTSLLYDLAKNRNRTTAQAEYRRYRNCGILLLLLNFILAAESVYIVCRNQSYHYDGMLIYVMAAIAFYALISAVIHIIRYRKYKSPVLSAIKAINLTTAMVTMLALETAMIAQFGGEDQGDFRRMMTSSTAAAVCLVEFMIAIYIISNGTRRISRQR